ncbi:thiosulfate sulfurtransferase GlpE [Methylosinus sp. Ce-a6]|uniref:thiosulfate sulfurtransferase GlpE n=1 Tax=Methylosinus sp. Ce-a6 TaxID=2172005 RepID=UPI001358612B|nr:thiosulfate sulfurtransferase GlpE [Methylosinus sp. Ce-a6]
MQLASFRRIDVAAARDIIGRGRALVIDVRDPESFARGHIDGAELASRENISSFVTLTPKDRPVVFCCYHGNSSQAYAKYFAEQGFAEVYSLDGGFEAWALAERAAPAPAALSPALEAFLAEHGFAPGEANGRNKDNVTPLMVAARLAPPALVAELLQAGADLHATNVDGNQALWLACVGEREENIALLIRAGIDIQHVNVNGATPLMFAASSGRARAVARLLSAGADPSFETDLGLTALDMAATKECLDLMRAEAKRRKAAAAAS